ncbi:TlpA disulfide reductase family protein [soil metagenome]|jgi:peroxiredoxin
MVGAVALVAVLLAACSGGKNAVDQSAGGDFRYVAATQKGTVLTADQRKKAGPVAGGLLAGGQYALAQDAGKVVVLNFFASWCGPCKVESPQFDALYRQRKATGVQFVGLDVKDPSKSLSEDFVKRADLTYPIVYDEPAKTASQLGNVPLGGLPATVLIDKQGRVAAVYTGAVLPRDLTPALDKLSAET